MPIYLESVATAFRLMASGDQDLMEILLLSMQVLSLIHI